MHIQYGVKLFVRVLKLDNICRLSER